MKYAIFQMRKEQREESPALLICYVDMLVGWKKRHSEKTKERKQNWAEEVQFRVVLPSLSQTNWEALDWVLPISILYQARMTGLSPSSLWVTGQMWAVLGRVWPWASQLLKLRHTSPTPCSKSSLDGGCGHISMSTSPPDWWQTGPQTPTLVESKL